MEQSRRPAGRRRFWSEFRAAGREIRWLLFFPLYLLPLSALVTLAVFLVEGRLIVPPTPFAWLLAVPATLLAFWAGALHDTPRGRIGSRAWRLLVLVMFAPLLWRAARNRGVPQVGRFAWAGWEAVAMAICTEAPSDRKHRYNVEDETIPLAKAA